MNVAPFQFSGDQLFYGLPLGLFVWALAVPLVRALRERSWKRYFMGLFVSLLAVFFPLFIFIFSAVLTPEWKGSSTFGWFGCFHVGKLALSPVVLWGAAAFCWVEVIKRPEAILKSWALWGIFAGALVAGILFIAECLLIAGGSTHFDLVGKGYQPWIVVPLLVTVWYFVVFATEYRKAEKGPKGIWWTTFSTTPFFWLTYYFSSKTFEALPDEPPSCFVVTAASRGFPRIVGPHCRLKRGDKVYFANRQLLRFWQFEALWKRTLPGNHRAFRRIYNRWGPMIARRADGPIRGALCYLLLKPFEWLAGLICLLFAFRTTD